MVTTRQLGREKAELSEAKREIQRQKEKFSEAEREIEQLKRCVPGRAPSHPLLEGVPGLG